MVDSEGNKSPCNRDSQGPANRFFGGVGSKDSKGDMEAETKELEEASHAEMGEFSSQREVQV